MTDVVYCDICREYDARVPATMAFCVQREDDATAPPLSVRRCDRHEGPAAVTAALLRRRLAPAAMFRFPLSSDTGRNPSLKLASVTAIGKEPPMEQRCAVGVMTLILLASLPGAGAAWNKAGHMVSGAIAYSDLKQASATALSRVVELLKAHPHFPTQWRREITKPFVPPEERDLSLDVGRALARR